VVTSGHVTKMAVTPFDPLWPKTYVLHADIMALCFIEPKFYIAWIWIFCLFFLWPWPLPDDLHIWNWPIFSGYIPEYQICKYELTTSRLSNVVAWQTDRQTDRQTLTEIVYHAAWRVIENLVLRNEKHRSIVRFRSISIPWTFRRDLRVWR